MRKLISMTLALLMIFTAVPVLFAGAASYQDVLLAPAALNGYVNDGPDGKNLTFRNRRAGRNRGSSR